MTSSPAIQQAKVRNILDICFIVYVAVTRPRVPNPRLDRYNYNNYLVPSYFRVVKNVKLCLSKYFPGAPKLT